MESVTLVGTDKKWRMTLTSLEQLRKLSQGFWGKDLDMILKVKQHKKEELQGINEYVSVNTRCFHFGRT